MICKLQELVNEFESIREKFENSKELQIFELVKLYGVCCRIEYQLKKLITQENIEDMQIVYLIQELEQNILNMVTKRLGEVENHEN